MKEAGRQEGSGKLQGTWSHRPAAFTGRAGDKRWAPEQEQQLVDLCPGIHPSDLNFQMGIPIPGSPLLC